MQPLRRRTRRDRPETDVLAHHCDDAGRDPVTITMTVITAADPLTDVDVFLALAETYAALGISTLWVGFAAADLPGWVHRVGELVIPRLRDLRH